MKNILIKKIKKIKSTVIGGFNRPKNYVIDGIVIPDDKNIISNSIAYRLKTRKYEGSERKILLALLKKDDRFLELGGGLGLISTIASRFIKEGEVCCVEANPKLVDYIRCVHKLNNARVDLISGAASDDTSGTAVFNCRKDFWSSSLSSFPKDVVEQIVVPVVNLKCLIESFRPSVIGVDIEGGEVDLFKFKIPKFVRAIYIEIHPKVTEEVAIEKLKKRLLENKFLLEVKKDILLACRD